MPEKNGITLVNTERLTHILTIIGASQFVHNSRPISAALIAPSDGGKSSIIVNHLPPGARVINDFTFASMLNLLNDPAPPQWIVVPDFNAVISHRPTVATLTLAFLLALLAEGVTEIPGLEGRAKLKSESLRNKGLTISLLTAMTADMFFSKRGKWRQTGFLRRIAPIYFTYSSSSITAIQGSISRGADMVHYQHNYLKKLKRQHVSIPAKLAEMISSLSALVTTNQLCWNYRDRQGEQRSTQGLDFPFSVHKIFRAYAKSSALLYGRNIVDEHDYKNVTDFSRFVRYDRPEEI